MPWATSHAQSPRHTRWQRVVATGLPSSRLDSPAGPMGAPNRTHPQGLLILPRGPAVVQGSSLASAVTLLPRAATSIKTGLPLYPACTIEDPPPCRRRDVSLADEACGARSPIMEGGEAGAMKTDGQDTCERRGFNSDDDPDIVSSPARQRRSAAAGESCPLAVNEQAVVHMWCVEPQQQGARPAPGLSLAAACPFRVHATRELVATKVLRSHSSPRHLKTHTLFGDDNMTGQRKQAADKQATQRSGEGQRHQGRAKQGDERVVVSSRARDHPDQCGTSLVYLASVQDHNGDRKWKYQGNNVCGASSEGQQLNEMETTGNSAASTSAPDARRAGAARAAAAGTGRDSSLQAPRCCKTMNCRKRSLQPAPKVPVPRNDMHGNAGPVAFALDAGVHVAAKPTPSLRGSDHRDDHSSLQAILSSAHFGVRLHRRHPTKQVPPASIVSFTCRGGRDPCCCIHARFAHISERAPCRTKRLVRQGRELRARPDAGKPPRKSKVERPFRVGLNGWLASSRAAKGNEVSWGLLLEVPGARKVIHHFFRPLGGMQQAQKGFPLRDADDVSERSLSAARFHASDPLSDLRVRRGTAGTLDVAPASSSISESDSLSSQASRYIASSGCPTGVLPLSKSHRREDWSVPGIQAHVGRANK
ncbi:hypothetical protein ACCO45_004706 [Purpureocillium lilacinum]|uniref:Uncharacterized protein n=1 Tax=Purpureocillium lilacinum TaxID=33203 RepID=A0ACC4DUN0_PURLI